jgi:predicted MFS family arabinose efflux permease
MAIAGLRYKWYCLALLFSIGALNYGDRTAISAVFPLLRVELGMSNVALAAIGSLFLWSYAAASPLAGLLADRYSRSRIVVFSLSAWSVITIFTGFSRTAHELLLTRVLLGLAESAYLPAAIALISDHHGSETRATAMGLHTAGLNFGLVAGGTLAGFLGDHLGWRPSFYVLGAAGLLLAVVAWGTLHEASPTQAAVAAPARVRETLATLARIPTFWIIIAEAMLMAVSIWMFLNWLPLYFRETFNMSLAAAGFSGTFLLQAAGTVGAAAGGWCSDRIARKHPSRRMLFQALCYLGAAPCLLMFLGRPAFAVLGVCIVSFAFLRALGSVNELAVLCDLLPTRLRSTAIGLMNTTNTLAGGMGVFVAGYLKQDFGLGGVFGGASFTVLLASLLLMLGYKRFLRRDMLRSARHAGESDLLGLAKIG